MSGATTDEKVLATATLGQGAGVPDDPVLRAESICSISESLAHALVSSLSKGARDRSAAVYKRRKGPSETTKRAAQFRSVREWIRSTIQPDMRVAEFHIGDRSGKDKGSKFFAYHWETSEFFSRLESLGFGGRRQEDQLVLVWTSVRARDVSISIRPMLTVSRHALMRLFYRLKTTDTSVVLRELEYLAPSTNLHYRMNNWLSATAELLIPSPGGAFVVAADSFFNGEVIAKTWMSDARMADNPRRAHAVAVARSEDGVVINETSCFPIISQQRVFERLIGRSSSALQTDSITAETLNSVADVAYLPNRRLPADWRFRDVQNTVMNHG